MPDSPAGRTPARVDQPMTELGLPVAVLVSAVTMTYLFCLRPMRKGHACHQSTSPPAEAEDRALREARLELDRLRTTPAAAGGDRHPDSV